MSGESHQPSHNMEFLAPQMAQQITKKKLKWQGEIWSVIYITKNIRDLGLKPRSGMPKGEDNQAHLANGQSFRGCRIVSSKL